MTVSTSPSSDVVPPAPHADGSGSVPTGSVYGTILVSALVVGMGRKTDSAGAIIEVILTTVVVFALAHAWSGFLAVGVTNRGRIEWKDFGQALVHEWPLVQAAWPAVIALGLAVLDVYSTSTGAWIALIANSVVLYLWGVWLARLDGARWLSAMVLGAITCAFGLVLVALNVIVH